MVSEIVGRDRSPKVAALMVGCWSRDIDGIVRCLRWSRRVDGIYPLYSDSLYPRHNQPITSLATIDSYSANPLVDPKTHFGTGTVELFLCHDSHDPHAYQPMFYVYPFS